MLSLTSYPDISSKSYNSETFTTEVLENHEKLHHDVCRGLSSTLLVYFKLNERERVNHGKSKIY